MIMAPIRVKWDPEILAAGFRPSSIFDDVEALNTTAPIHSVGGQDVAVTASPAVNITAGLNALVRDVVERVVALAVNTTTPVTTTTTSTTTIVPSWTTTTSPALLWTTTPTTIRRAVERVTLRPVVPVEYVSIFSLNNFLECDRCNRTQQVEFIT